MNKRKVFHGSKKKQKGIHSESDEDRNVYLLRDDSQNTSGCDGMAGQTARCRQTAAPEAHDPCLSTEEEAEAPEEILNECNGYQWTDSCGKLISL